MEKKYLLIPTVFLILLQFNTGISVLANGLSNAEKTEVTSYATKPADDLRHISNMYVDPGFKYMAYKSDGELHMYLYNDEKTQYLSNMYIVLPVGLTTNGGIDAVQKELVSYSEKLNIIDGSLTVRQLPNSSDGREVYQITPSSGAYVEKGGTSERLSFKFPVKATPKDSGLSSIVFNANTMDDMEKNILFVGADNVNFDSSVSSYPEINANKVGIVGTDSVVRGIVFNGIERTINLFSPQVKDTYTVYEQGTNFILATKDKTGTSEDKYSRIGLVDNLSVLGLDSTIYDENSLIIDSGTLSDTVEWLPQGSLTNNPNEVMKGKDYSMYVKRYAKDITVNYVDENNNKISDSVILSGDIGDSYAVEQKKIDDYTFKEVKGNTAGTFTDQEQEVTFVYTKNPVKASPIIVRYVDTEEAKLSSEVLLEGNIGDSYTTEQKELDGYTFKEVKGNTTGIFTNQEQEVTYVYDKVQDNPIVPPLENNNKTEDNNINEEYSVDAPQNDGTQFPQTGEQVVSKMWGYIGFTLLVISVFIFIKKSVMIKNKKIGT